MASDGVGAVEYGERICGGLASCGAKEGEIGKSIGDMDGGICCCCGGGDIVCERWSRSGIRYNGRVGRVGGDEGLVRCSSAISISSWAYGGQLFGV